MRHLYELEFAETVQLIDGRAMEPQSVTRLLEEAGFGNVEVESFPLTFDATPADVWACFATSYDPVRLAPADLDALREAFFTEVQALLGDDGRVPFQFGMQQITAEAHRET